MPATKDNFLRRFGHFLITFFPVQLFLLHLRRSFILMIFWLLLFAFVGGGIAENYGLRYLFVTPEYLDKVSFFSYFLVGITAGLFIMAFHISSYIYYSYRYPFLATMQNPLYKFSLNNSIIPLLFYGFYIFQIILISPEEDMAGFTTFLNIGSLTLGIVLMILFSFSYFIATVRILELPDEKGKEKNPLKPLKLLMKKGKRIGSRSRKSVNSYLRTPFKLKRTRDVSHYSAETLLETIQQHHFSASVFFVALIFVVIILGLVGDYQPFVIPAGGTIFLIFSLYLMITGVFYTRFKTWTLTVGIIALLLLNWLSGLPKFRTINYAYGMDYETRAAYNYDRLDALTADSIVQKDKAAALQVLEKWKAKQPLGAKPKMVVLNVSGGGQRSALWTLKILQELDALTEGDFYNQMHLITGSSGGMLGAALYREVKYREQIGTAPLPADSDSLQVLLSKDLLNPVTFTLAVNDLFFRLNRVNYMGQRYPKDRGWAFDRELDKNTLGLLDRHFGAYRKMEMESQMPTLILGPAIVGDGRKLLMSPQGISYLTFTTPYAGIRKPKVYDGVEYSRLFKNQNAQNLSFITALRMSASFPYITPLVNMPSEPSIELIDAGVRDNEGFELALRYLYAFQDWIRENTCGVVVVQIKANRPDKIPIKQVTSTKLDGLTRPIGGVFKSFHNLQVYNKSLLMEVAQNEMEMEMDVVRFSLFQEDDAVSLSWHLTEEEKRRTTETFYSDINQTALKSLLKKLGKTPKKSRN